MHNGFIEKKNYVMFIVDSVQQSLKLFILNLIQSFFSPKELKIIVIQVNYFLANKWRKAEPW